jgi:hypothetical protein
MTDPSRTQCLATAFWIAASIDLVFIAGWVFGFLSGHAARDVADSLFCLFLLGAFGLLGVLMLIFALVHNPWFRGLALVVVAIPMLYRGIDLAKDLAGNLTAPSPQSLHQGHGYFQTPADRALADAIVSADARRVAELARAADLKAVGYQGMTFMRLALRGPVDPAVVAALLRAGANPDEDRLLFGTVAAPRGQNVMIDPKNEPLLRSVLATGIDLNHPDLDGSPRFFSALDWPEGLELMLEHGANVEAEDAKGNTAIMDAVEFGQQCWPAIDVLLKHGARKDHVAHDGRSLREVVKDVLAQSGRAPPQLSNP